MMSCPCNKYVLNVNCFEDKAIYIIKNLFWLTKGHLVPLGELLEF